MSNNIAINKPRLFPIIIPLVVLFFFEVFFYYPKMTYVCLVMANLAIFFIVWQFTLLNKKLTGAVKIVRDSSLKDWKKFFMLPSIFSTSLAAYSALSINNYLTQVLFLLNLVFLYFYFRFIYYYLLAPSLFREQSFLNLVLFGNFLSFFFLSSTVYGLQSFLDLPVWELIIIILFGTLLIVYQALWTNDFVSAARVIPEDKTIQSTPINLEFFYALICSAVIVEIGWTLFFLPINYNIAGIILSLFYYILINLIKLHIANQLNKRAVKLYLFLGFFSILLILLTARWL